MEAKLLPGYGEQMMGYIERLAARSLNKIDVIWPRTASIFEPQSPGGGYISRLAAVNEVRGDIPIIDEMWSRRRSGQTQDWLARPGEDENESLKISLKRSSIQPSIDASPRKDAQEPSTWTLRSHSTFEQKIQPARSTEVMSQRHPSGDDLFREPDRESSASALKKEFEEASARRIRPNSTFMQEVQPIRSAEEMSEGYLSREDSFREPAREDHKGISMIVPEALPKVVPHTRTRSTIAQTASSRHIPCPSVSKLPDQDESNEPNQQDVYPRRRRISAMLRTAGIQSKDESPGPKAFPHTSSEPYPVIHVAIGRVEVKASHKPHPPEEKNNLGNIMSLEEYLRRPRGRG